jgi:hypothetical protein
VVAGGAVACGSSSKARKVETTTDTDAGAQIDASSSSAGATGTGGAGGKGTGGAPGSGGTASGGTSAVDSGPVDSGNEASIDAAPLIDASKPAVSCTADAGVEAGLRWKDFSNGTCQACPATPPACNDLVRVGTTYDRATRKFVVQLPAGMDEIRSAQFVFRYYGTLADGGPTRTFPNTVPAVIVENTLTFDLSGVTPPSLQSIQQGAVQFTDACGQNGDTGIGNTALEINFVPTDAGTTATLIDCYSNT